MFLDAFALVALMLEEPAADEVEALLRDTNDPASTGAVNLGEVVDRVTRVGGLDLGDVLNPLSALIHGGLLVHPVETFEGMTAGAIREKFYRRDSCALSMADCIALVTALRHDEGIATADPPLAATARAMKIPVHALPDSNGQRP